MLDYLLLILGTVFLTPIVLALIRIYKSRVNLKFYEKQGLKVFFDPFKGPFGLYSKKHPGNDKRSNLEYLKKLAKENDHLPGIVANHIQDNMSAIFLHDPEYIREFLIQEDNFDKGTTERGWPDHAGFWLYNGDKAAKGKAVFSDVFNYDALSTFIPKLCEIIMECLQDFTKAKQIDSNSFKTINLDELCEDIFERVLYVLIFGQAKMEHTVLGKSVVKCVMDNFHLIPAVRTNPVFVLFPELAARFRLCKQYHESYRYNEVLMDYMDKWYKKRESEGNLKNCVFDRIILHNQKCKKEGRMEDALDLQQVVGFVNIMQVTGSDTSQNTTKMVICKMGDREDLKELLNKINGEIFDKHGLTDDQRLHEHELLELWLKETLRIYTPAARVVPRVAKSDLVLKDLRIRKGDSLSVNYPGMMNKEEVFPDPEIFKLDRFSKENEKAIPKYQYIPFFVGKRNCLGKHLAELMIKLITCHFIRTYDHKIPVGVEYYVQNILTNQVANPFVDVRLKKAV